MMGNRFSDEIQSEQTIEDQIECGNDFFCYKGFPWQAVAKETDPKFFASYQELLDNPYDLSKIRNSPLLHDREESKQRLARTFDYVAAEMEKNRLLRSGVRQILFSIPGYYLPGGWSVASNLAGGVTGQLADINETHSDAATLKAAQDDTNKKLDVLYHDKIEEAEFRKSAQEIQTLHHDGGLKAKIEKIYADATPEGRQTLKDAAEKLAAAAEKLNQLAVKRGHETVARLKTQRAKEANASKPDAFTETKDIWKASAQTDRMEFEVARELIPPDRLYQLAKDNSIPLPEGVKLETLEAAANAYTQSQEYQEIRKTVQQTQQFGQLFIGIASKMGMDGKTAQALNKALAITGSLVTAFYPPTPVNVAFSVLGIIGSLLPGDKDGMQEAIAQIVELQKEILTQIRLMRMEMQQNQEELLGNLQKSFESIRYDTIHIRSILSDEVESKTFDRCSVVGQLMKPWEDEQKAKGKTKATIADFLASLDSDQRKSVIECLEKIEILVVKRDTGSIHAYFSSKIVPGSPGTDSESRAKYSTTESEGAQNHFDFLLIYADRYGDRRFETDRRILALPAQNYSELKQKLRADVTLPISYSEDVFREDVFKVLLVPSSLTRLAQEGSFLSNVASNLNGDGSVIVADELKNLLSLHKSIGVNKRVYSLLSRTRDLLALARAQQNLMNGDVLLPTVWKNLNIGLASLHLQRIMSPTKLGVLSSEKYRETLRVLDENPLLASNMLAWGIWEFSRPGQVSRYRPLGLQQSYKECYDDSSSAALLSFFMQFVTKGTAISEQDQKRMNLKGQVPETIPAWGEANIKFICWTEANTMSQISIVESKLNALDKLDVSDPTRDLRDPSRITDPEKEGSRAKERQSLNDDLRTLNNLLKSACACDDPPASNAHKWFVRFPESKQFIALPLPSKISKQEIYSSLSSQKVYQLSEQLETELFDYDWEYWQHQNSLN
jgi:hypothetical protein